MAVVADGTREIQKSETVESLSVVIDTKEIGTQDRVQIVNAPKILTTGQNLIVDFQCSSPKKVGVEVRVWTALSVDAVVFQRRWVCGSKSAELGQKHVRVRLPAKYAYKPNHTNPRCLVVEKCRIYTWMLDLTEWHSKKLIHPSIASQANVKGRYQTEIVHPYERPQKPVSRCHIWWKEIQIKQPYLPVCGREHGKYFIDYTIMLTDHHPPFTKGELISTKFNHCYTTRTEPYDRGVAWAK